MEKNTYDYVEQLFKCLDEGTEKRSIRVYDKEIPLNTHTWNSIFGGDGREFVQKKKDKYVAACCEMYMKIKRNIAFSNLSTYKSRAIAVKILSDMGFTDNQIMSALNTSIVNIEQYKSSHNTFVAKDIKYRGVYFKNRKN